MLGMNPNRLLQGWIEVLQREIRCWMDDVLKDTLNPDLLQHFFNNLGIDMSKVFGMIGKQPGIDPYAVLGLTKNATDQEIKTRYRDLIKKLHPDVSGSEGTVFLFRMVLAAFEMIKKERGWT
jgi:DnaJ-domain-containing protein 1